MKWLNIAGSPTFKIWHVEEVPYFSVKFRTGYSWSVVTLCWVPHHSCRTRAHLMSLHFTLLYLTDVDFFFNILKARPSKSKFMVCFFGWSGIKSAVSLRSASNWHYCLFVQCHYLEDKRIKDKNAKAKQDLFWVT